jgi:uncharacterized repeat protein (TIGR04052 family)
MLLNRGAWVFLAACLSADPTRTGDEAAAEGSDLPRLGQDASSPLDSDSTEATQSVRIRFRAQVDAELFACNSTYASAAGVTFTPRDLRFFVQDVSLLTAQGTAEPVTLDVLPPWQLAEVALLDFEDGTGSCSAGTAAVNLDVTGRVRPGSYRGLAFTNGVPEALNHADPAGLPPPLQAGNLSWGWLLGYRFLVAELVASDPGDGSPPGSALLHLGSTACSGSPTTGSIRCENANRNRVYLPTFDPDADVVVVDLAELFEGVDLTRITTCHSHDESCTGLLERIGVQRRDGSALAEQRLYRVEAL